MDKYSFFWCGTITHSELEQHSFFDVKVRKNPSTGTSEPSYNVYSSDLPPLPVQPEHHVKITLLLESNVGGTTIRYRIAEVTFSGSQLEGKQGGKVIAIKTPEADWHFTKQDIPAHSHTSAHNSPASNTSSSEATSSQPFRWLLYYISIRVPTATLRKFLSRISPWQVTVFWPSCTQAIWSASRGVRAHHRLYGDTVATAAYYTIALSFILEMQIPRVSPLNARYKIHFIRFLSIHTTL